jgi:hypothetical protein
MEEILLLYFLLSLVYSIQKNALADQPKTYDDGLFLQPFRPIVSSRFSFSFFLMHILSAKGYRHNDRLFELACI